MSVTSAENLVGKEFFTYSKIPLNQKISTT